MLREKGAQIVVGQQKQENIKDQYDLVVLVQQ
jgi:hypothetical protein